MTLGQVKCLLLTLVVAAELAGQGNGRGGSSSRGRGSGRDGYRGGGGGSEISIFQGRSMDGQRQMVSHHLTTKMHKLTKFPTDKLPQINKIKLE